MVFINDDKQVPEDKLADNPSFNTFFSCWKVGVFFNGPLVKTRVFSVSFLFMFTSKKKLKLRSSAPRIFQFRFSKRMFLLLLNLFPF